MLHCPNSEGHAVAFKIFRNSLSIQAAFNYHGMQNLGFAFSLLPLARELKDDKERLTSFFTRHLQLFNTHPYLSAAVIGSVVRLERNGGKADVAGNATVNLKNALAGPYAALGDSFFWGAMKPLAAVIGVLLAWQSSLMAPLALLILYNPVHFWVRIAGFVEGYRRGMEGVDFIKRLDLPRVTRRIRQLSLLGLSGIALMASPSFRLASPGLTFSLLAQGIYLSLIILCYWGIRKGLSQVKMLYWMFIVSCALSI